MASTRKEAFSVNDMPSLAGFIAIVTGGSDGIGYVASYQLAIHGARVYIMSRSLQKAVKAISNMQKSTPGKELDLHFLQVDLQSLGSVNEAAQRFKETESRLDILVNNAGIMAVPYALTPDGYETQWQTNYLSPFFLIKSLLPVLCSTAAGTTSQGRVRIVNVSSDAAFVAITPDCDLENPNLDHLKGNLAIKAYAVHPGVIETNLQAADPTILGKIVKFSVKWGLVPGKLGREDGARTTLACATGEDKGIVEGSGAFFGPFGQRDKRGDALIRKWQPKNIEEKLWKASEKMLREKGFEV
ncbi:hypothetical protein HO133_007981 [Letharia lupina]|uniref:NAD(P)-binding protein n=1 Tax=Letharia lupina TaxID=560253 RepID=A0A8H6CRX2_9LECA|nr:uncharacterized protein HO133_007981 [Letharia lupina]KAF6228251.1 hypothetical protein HO133_007981 [Letharia lupina]